jgi:hypothetical protein
MEYRIDKATKVLYFILAGFCALIGGALLVYGLATHGFGEQALGLIGGILILLAGVVLVLQVYRLNLTIDDYSLTTKNVFSSRTIQLSKIDGYRRGPRNQLYLVLKSDGKRLSLSQGLGKRQELIQWLAENYSDIDVRENKKELEVLLGNERFGGTKEDRQARLDGARKLETTSTVVGFGLFFWSLFASQPYELTMIVLFVMPWIAVAVTWYFKGLMKLYKRKSSPYPSVVPLMFFTILSAWVAVLRDYNLYRFEKDVWLFLIGGTILGTVICVGVCWQAIVTSAKKVLTYSCIVVMAGLYSYSLLVFSNCYYDRSEPDVYPVTVTGMRISSGRSTSYYLTLSAWGPYREGKEISVPRSFYEGVKEQDRVNVVSKKGKWKMGWFWVER